MLLRSMKSKRVMKEGCAPKFMTCSDRGPQGHTNALNSCLLQISGVDFIMPPCHGKVRFEQMF